MPLSCVVLYEVHERRLVRLLASRARKELWNLEPRGELRSQLTEAGLQEQPAAASGLQLVRRAIR